MFYSQSTKGFYVTEIHGTNIPSDAVEITEAKHSELLNGQAQGKQIVADANGNPYLADPPPSSQAEVIAMYERALDAHLDAVANTYRYDDRKSFALRAGYPGPYQSEGLAFAQWMDTCNVQAYALLQSVMLGEIAMPTIEEMISGLPVFTPSFVL